MRAQPSLPERAPAPAGAGAPVFARYLLAACVPITVCASLYPLSGWSDPGVGPFAFLGALRPRYVTAFDLVVNVLVYAPLGFLAALSFPSRRGGCAAAAAGFGAATLLSLAMEALQTYLPARNASNLDLACNAGGALLGAVLAASLARALTGQRGPGALRHRWFRAGRGFDLGLVLLVLWLLAQLNPGMLLFGNGDLRELAPGTVAEFHAPVLFIRGDAVVAGANVAAAGLLLGLLVPRGRPVRALFLALVAAGLGARALAWGTVLHPPGPMQWVSLGALIGAAAGVLAALPALGLPRPLQLGLCAALLAIATAVVNFAPANPYLAAASFGVRDGFFVNFNGMTRLLAAVWPLLALAFLAALRVDLGRRSD
ncbi:MAG: VanZ family protein [Burkholderiales bacterium]|nr:VanZ family protein [Burkholderiales bacterium]